MGLEIIMLCEVSWVQKDKGRMFSFIRRRQTHINLNMIMSVIVGLFEGNREMKERKRE
jgi:hypothetical protein